ncbi:MAG: hypothetical protein CME38_00475 [Haliea sp.]|nr:hypothetical protein [Haliea sp.]
MIRVFKAYRNWGLHDQPEEGDVALVMDEDTMWHAQAFAVSCCVLTEFYSVNYPEACLSAINVLYARCKILRHLRGEESLPKYVREGLFSSVIDGEDLYGLTVHQAALLGGVSEQAVRNAMARSDWFKMEAEQHGKSIPIEKALRWLQARPGFEVAPEPGGEGDLLVPVAADGSYFSRSCEQRSGFKIGPKGDEKYYKSFDAALDVMGTLQAAGKPVYFRRPNANHRFGIVRAVRWEYRSRDQVLGSD